MVLHLLPGGTPRRVLLHRLAEELEALEGDLDVLRPRPRSFLNLTIEQLEGHLIRRLLGHIKDKHARQHLVEDHTDGPYVNLVAVAVAAAPVRLNLLRWHHQGGALEGEGSVSPASIVLLRRILKLSRVA